MSEGPANRVRIPAPTIEQYCKRPCPTCPFRADKTPYQRQQDVRSNLRILTTPSETAVCHYSVGRVWSPIETKVRSQEPVPRMCAGLLLTLQKFELPNDWLASHAVAGLQQVPLYDSLQDFAQRALCPDQRGAARCAAWNACLPGGPQG